jgi:hypothetical protein
VDREQSAFLGAPHYAVRGNLRDELGEQADDVDTHG